MKHTYSIQRLVGNEGFRTYFGFIEPSWGTGYAFALLVSEKNSRVRVRISLAGPTEEVFSDLCELFPAGGFEQEENSVANLRYTGTLGDPEKIWLELSAEAGR